MKLYDLELSGNCYKVRLLLSALGLDYEKVAVNLMEGEHKQPPFLAINPKGQVPALDDAGTILSDSQAILVYLALTYDADRTWLPKDPATQAQIHFWLSTTANEIQNGPSKARLVKLFKMDLNYDAAVATSSAVLALINDHLAGRDWLVGDHATIADLAAFPYIALAGDGDIDLSPYGNIASWITRIKTLPGFVPMPGVEAAVA